MGKRNKLKPRKRDGHYTFGSKPKMPYSKLKAESVAEKLNKEYLGVYQAYECGWCKEYHVGSSTVRPPQRQLVLYREHDLLVELGARTVDCLISENYSTKFKRMETISKKCMAGSRRKI